MVIDSLRTAHKLHVEGKLHRQLMSRLQLFILLVIIASFFVVYDVMFQGFAWWVATPIILVSAYVGLWLSKIYTITWDEEQQILVAGRLDRTGIVILIIYGIGRLATQLIFKELHADVLLGFSGTLAIILGIGLGRLIGFAQNLDQVHQKSLRHSYRKLFRQ